MPSNTLPLLDSLPTLERADAVVSSMITVRLSQNLEEVESVWRALEAEGVESPGQSFDFIRLWVASQAIPAADQVYLVAELGGRPLALLPLHLHLRKGVRVLSFFPGAHVGCNAPLVDGPRLLALGADGRRALWQSMLKKLEGVDVVHLRAVPERLVDGVDLFAELGRSLVNDTLYRASFGSWEEANTLQRNKSRRKHDRQQGEKLDAMGVVTFEEISNGPQALALLDRLFSQRAARFVEMGVADPFCATSVRGFYDAAVAADSGVPVRLHALRLDGEVVALRYNIAHGDRLFCLISSMSTAPAIQPGSPGKQCLLRVMQTEFDNGTRVFDMGSGFTDEKRHWCNVQIPVREHYLAVTPVGAVAAKLHGGWLWFRRELKSNPRLLATLKALRAGYNRHRTGETPPVQPS
jgi:CelD/BcsL family acetyltransferase involved in cellulose biosynthesis